MTDPDIKAFNELVIYLGKQGLEIHSLSQIGPWTGTNEFSGSTLELMHQKLEQ